MDIKNEILTFIRREEETGALLLTGAWGIGKTYFIKSLAEELNSARKEFLCVISLFGIDSVASLTKTVKEGYLAARSKIFSKTARKIGKAIVNAVDKGLKIAETATGDNVAVSAVQKSFSTVLSLSLLDFFSVRSEIGNGKAKRKFVLIFDDFERCKIDIVDLLGTINEYCENWCIKTIILADESKILGDGIDQNNDAQAHGEKDIRVKQYSDFKEKVVFQTLRFEVLHSEIIEGMIDSYKESVQGYVDFLRKNCDVIKQAFFEKGNGNLRAIKWIITNFERVFKIIKTIENPDEKIVARILYSFVVKSCAAKTKFTSRNASSDPMVILKNQYNAFDDLTINSNIITMYSLQKWIEKEEFDENSVMEEIKNICSPDRIPNKVKVLTRPILDLDYDTTQAGLQDALNDAYEGKLTCTEYISLLERLQTYSVYRIPIEFVDYKKFDDGIKNYIDHFKANMIQDDSAAFVPNAAFEWATEYTRPLLEKMAYIVNNQQAWLNRTKFINVMKRRENLRNNFNIKGLEEFDDEMLKIFWNAYINADNENKQLLAHHLMSFDFVREGSVATRANHTEKKIKLMSIQGSIDNFNRLDDLIAGLIDSEIDYITRAVQIMFKEKIAEKIEQLDNALTRLKTEYQILEQE